MKLSVKKGGLRTLKCKMLFVSCILNYVLIQMLSFLCRLWVTNPKYNQITQKEKMWANMFRERFFSINVSLPFTCRRRVGRSSNPKVQFWYRKKCETKKRTKDLCNEQTLFSFRFFSKAEKKKLIGSTLNALFCVSTYAWIRSTQKKSPIKWKRVAFSPFFVSSNKFFGLMHASDLIGWPSHNVNGKCISTRSSPRFRSRSRK